MNKVFLIFFAIILVSCSKLNDTERRYIDFCSKFQPGITIRGGTCECVAKGIGEKLNPQQYNDLVKLLEEQVTKAENSQSAENLDMDPKAATAMFESVMNCSK